MPTKSKVLKAKNDRNAQLKRNYNISLVEYANLCLKQNGICAICNKSETRKYNGKVMSLVVDHDHTTGKVRGLLCHACNVAIGLSKENIETLQAMIIYLSRPGDTPPSSVSESNDSAPPSGAPFKE